MNSHGGFGGFDVLENVLEMSITHGALEVSMEVSSKA